jgi:hypothetical protein
MQKEINSNIYKFLEYFEKRPFMFVRHKKMTVLDSFLSGLVLFRDDSFFIDEKHIFPNFNLFTTWIGGMLNYPYKSSSGNYSWLIKEKFKTEKKSYDKFFEYLSEFKKSKIYYLKIELTNDNIRHCLENRNFELRCGYGNSTEKAYMKNVKKLKSIFIYQLKPSKSIFVILTDKNDSILDNSNVDMTGRVLLKEINLQFNLNINEEDLREVESNCNEILKFSIK